MRILSVGILCFAMLMVGCGDGKPVKGDGGTKNVLSKAQGEAANVLTKITGALEGVKDGETAKAAKSQLDTLVDQVKPLMAKVKKVAAEFAGTAKAATGGMDAGNLGAVGSDLATKAKSALGGPLKDVMTKLTAQISRIAGDQKLLEPLKGVIEKLQAAIKL